MSRMADPPKIRRPSTRPPPIPRASAPPVAPAPARTDAYSTQSGEVIIGEDTHGVQAPDAGELVEAMLELVATEAEALLGGNGTDAKLADLNVRTALASWDALDQPDQALRFLELAEAHPLVPRLRFAASLANGSPEDLAAVEERLRNFPALAIELAEAWLWRHGRMDRTITICDRLLATELPPTWRTHVTELALLAHAATANWSRVIDLLRAKLTSVSPPEEIATAAALILDRAGDAALALATAWDKLEHFPGADDNMLGWLRCFDVAIDAATVIDDVRRFDLLDKRADLISTLPGGALEALATRHAVASELERDGQHLAAATLWSSLADESTAQTPGARSRASLRARSLPRGCSPHRW